MGRVISGLVCVVLAVILSAGTGYGEIVTGKQSAGSLRGGYVEWSFGLGGSFPLYDTEDDIRIGLACDFRMNWHPSKKSGWGMWLGGHYLWHTGKKADITVDRPHLLADGTAQNHFNYFSALVGPEWTLGTPYTRDWIPRIAAGAGVTYAFIDRWFTVTGFNEKERLRISESDQAAFVLAGRAGLFRTAGEHNGLSLEVIYTHMFGIRTGLPDEGDKRDLGTLGVVFNIHLRSWKGR